MEHVIKKILNIAKEYGGNLAVSDEQGGFTYKQFVEFAKIIAGNLIKNGIIYGDHIIIEAKRSKEYVAAMFGCWIIGCVVVPLSDDYPLDRLEYIKKDCGYKFLIDNEFIKNLDKKLSAEPIIANINDDSLIIYTSGSTGNPKGVLHSFLSMTSVASRNSIQNINGVENKNTIVGLIAPFTFIVGMGTTICCLYIGKHLVLAPDEIRKDPYKLAKYYDDNNIDSSFVPPRLVNFMLENNKSLKIISVGSERISNIYFDEHPVVINGYGSTETFGGILAFHIDKKYKNTPIGKPFGKEVTYVLDDHNNEVEIGELCIAGNVANGYYNLPEETKRAFVENPFKEKDGFPRMFRTRDIVKRLPDGNLVFIERKDWMIKINGQRVEPLEIESCIRNISGIDNVAIKDFTNKNGVTLLAAYYVSNSNIKPEVIKKYCKSHLTSYMVPAFYIKLDKLPVNPNGKLDRKNLPEPDINNFKNEYIKPINKIEISLCKAIKEVLNCGEVGREDDFFLLGGDSIKALEVINALDELPIDLETIFKGKTVKEIAFLIEKNSEDEIVFDRKKKDSYPLTSSQLGIYFPCLNNPSSTQYNNPIMIELDEKVDKKKFIFAVEKAVNNHKAYKCKINIINGTPSMVEVDRNITVKEIKVDDIDTSLKEFVKPFDLANDELIRLNLFVYKNRNYFVFDAHHIVFDGTTLAVLLKEIQSAYKGNELLDERTSAFDLSSYEEALKKSNKYTNAKEYFKNIFDGIDIVNDFPEDYDNKNENKLGNITTTLNLDHEKLNKFLKGNAVTENSFLLAVFSFVLAKFNGSDKSLVCVAESGRHTAMTFNTAGMLVKTIALPVELENYANIGDYVKDLQNLFKNSSLNDSYPFYELANEYHLSNDFMFVYQSNQFSSLKLEDNLYKVVGLPTQNSISKITLMAFKEDDAFRLSFSYRKDLYRQGIIQSFASTFNNVCKEFISKEVFNDINLTSTEEIKILDSFNNNKEKLNNKDVITYFNESVKKYPNKDVLIFKDKHISYKNADLITNKIANYIAKLGIKNNDVVAIMIPRNEMMFLATYGVLKSGAAYQPLDPTYPSERLSFMIHDSNAKLLITTKELEPLIKNYNNKVLYVEDIEDLKDDKEIKVNFSSSDLLTLLYTSGTTGVPKGVMITRGNISSLIQLNKKEMPLDDKTNFAAYASYGFDASMQDVLTAPCFGGTIVVVPEDIRLDLKAIDEYFIKNKVTHCFMTTQVGRQFVLFSKSNLSYFAVGGEKLVPFDPNEAKFPLTNIYGPTETTVYVAHTKIDKLYKRCPIGKANTNVSCYIVDKNLNRLPIGVPGELLIAGPQVAAGYLNQKERTEKSFIKNPFSSEKDFDRVYRTGDIVRYLEDGTLDIIGRNDGQVKIRGFRIELSEIESVIREIKEIKDCTVAAFDNPGGGKYVAVYLVSDTKLDLDKIKKYIQTRKPPYMVPEAMMQIDKIPLNQNHKVNRKALPIISKKLIKKENEIRKDNLVVIKIRKILKEILGEDNFDYSDNLFDYGMNSIAVVKLSVMLSEQFNINVDVKELLNDCSIESIENILLRFFVERTFSVDSSKHELRDSYPLTSSQVGIYTEYLKDTNSVRYNIPILITYNKTNYPLLTKAKLKEALLNVINAHPSINATIKTNKEGKFVMLPHFDAKPNVEEITLNEQEFENYCSNFVKPHDLAKSLYRFAIIEKNDALHLAADVNHIMFDGASQEIFFNELEKAIKGEKINKENYSIFDNAVDEENLRNSEKYQEAKNYYSDLLSVVDGSTKLERNVFKKETIFSSFNLKSDLLKVNELERFVKQYNITYNSFFLTAFAITLSLYTYQKDVCFTTVYNGRNTINLSKIIGMCVKTLPFVSSINGEASIKDLLLSNKEQFLKSMNYDIYPFSDLSREFDVLMDILFVYQGKMPNTNNLNYKYLSLNELKSNLDIEVRNDDDSFYYHVEYDEGMYSSSFIKGLVNSIILVSKQLISKEKIMDISLVGKDELKLLNNLNNNDEPYDKRPIMCQFKDIAKKYPNKDCVMYLDKKYTFKEVDDESDKLASYINSLGVSRGDVVSILIPRDECNIPIAYGVIKSGAGYQPLDCSYPNDRIDFMLNDSGAKLLITTKDLVSHTPNFKGKILYVEDLNKLPKLNDEYQIKTEPDDLFALLYTSGTTGTPKGTRILHSNISCFIHDDRIARMCDENTIGAEYASFGFDGCMMQFYTDIITGGTICIIPDDMRLDLPAIDEYLIKNKVTHTFMTTQVARQYVLMTKSPYLKSVAFGGEKIVPFYREGIKFKTFNLYGPTEGTCYSNYFEMNGVYERVPIGKPHPNTKNYVLDRYNHRLPAGCIGELALGGPQVSGGYLNRPDKTASVFLPNTFDSIEGCPALYKTGDIVRLNENGDIDIIGRNDSQVKVRGFRIEITEVEEVLRRAPLVKDVTINAYDDPSGGKYIAAYVVSESKIDVKAINSFIMNEKPPYMVPKVILQIDAIPLNSSGKVDKRKLPVPDLSSLGDEYVAPTNELEKEFCDLFGSILGSSNIGINDDFFMLGGSSINAAQVVSYAFTKGYDLVYKNVFDNPTPKMLAAFISKQNNINSPELAKEPNEFNGNIEPVFANNVSSSLGDLESKDIGDVLLFGSTGFLGSHVLKELLDSSTHKIICVVRNNEAQNAKDRLTTLLEFYFENDYEQEFDKRLFVVEGDLLDENIQQKLTNHKFNTIINCAALVKHFASDDSIEKTNAGGAKNLIKLALNSNAKLIHVSTLSVSGESINDSVPEEFRFKETMLNIGQTVDNKYTKSKFDAEVAIKDAIEHDGLIAKIIRVGNLMSRSSDGEFQINVNTNNFMNTIKAFTLIKAIPFDTLNHSVEFSQIDLVARAIVLLSSTNDKFNVFHVNNIHYIQMNNVINELNSKGVKIEKVNGEEFGRRLNNLLNKESDVRSLNALLAYRANRHEKRRMVLTDNSFTLDALYRLGFYWPLPDSNYLSNLIDYLISLEFLK